MDGRAAPPDMAQQKVEVMIIRHRSSFINLGIMVVFLSSLILSACEPQTFITFDNHRNSEIQIFVANMKKNGSTTESIHYGNVQANSSRRIHVTFINDDWINRIEVRDMNGNEISSRDYSRKDLESLNFTIVISK